jgi:hypothetical protein
MPAPIVGAAAAAAARAVSKKVATEVAKKAVTKKTTDALKKSALKKLEKVGKTKSEAHLSSALRQGQITKQEAAALDPKNFKILLEPPISSRTINLKTGKVTRGK